MLRDLVSFVQFQKHEKHAWRLLACNFTKSKPSPWVFFTFFKLYKCYQISQRITYVHNLYKVSFEKIVSVDNLSLTVEAPRGVL